MEDAVGAGEDGSSGAVGEIELEHVERRRVPLLARAVVVVGVRVDGDDLVPGREQRLGQVRADEARGACDDVSHRSTIP